MTNSPPTLPLRKIKSLPGFVINYLLCGPFNEDVKISSCQAFKKDYLGVSGSESTAEPKAGLKQGRNGHVWTPYAIRKGFVANLRNICSTEGVIYYAAAYLKCPKAQTANILIGSDDGFKLYLNGKLLKKNHIHRGLGIDNDVVPANLKKGVNRLLIKIEHCFGGYEFCLRITDRDGKAIPGLRTYLDHPSVQNPQNPLKRRTVSGFDYLDYKFAQAEKTMAFSAKDITEYRQWHRSFKAKFKQLLGKFPPPCPLKPEITEDVVVENFHRCRLLIDLEPGFALPCYLTIPTKIPEKGKLPAILCLHGHSDGKSDMVGLCLGTADEQPYSRNNAMALHAARAGYVTISPDFLAFGERCATNPFGIADACSAEFCWSQAVGINTTMLNVHTVKRCIDYLETLSFVDNRKIAVMGHSFGGYMATMATAVLPRISATVISGFMCEIESYYGRSWPCGSQVIPGLFNYGDLSDVACLFPPRPLLIITGLYDSVTPSMFGFSAFRKIKSAYKVTGNEKKAFQHTFSGGHIFQPEAALQWLWNLWFDR